MAQLNSLIVTGNSRFLNPINGNARNGVYYVKGTQTATTGSWTGAIPIPALYDGLTIMYYLPYAGSGNATLNLTLSTGTTTGAINCYYSTSRLTTHYGKGSNIVMTYHSAGSISIDGTATTDNRWIANANYDTTYSAMSVSELTTGTATTSRVVRADRLKQGIEEIIEDNISNKMDKVNPTGSGSFSLNRKADTTIGNYAFAEGLDATASGNFSHSEGHNTTASSDDSHAEGYETIAAGSHSHSEGYQSQTTQTANGGHAEGYNTNASGGTGSHAEGNGSKAQGEASHAEGAGTTASGIHSHAEGMGSTASNAQSHAEGSQTTASGAQSHAEGSGTQAVGNYSHAEGGGSQAKEQGSHAEGSGTIANGFSSHAEGGGSQANGAYSHAEGGGTIAASEYQHVSGKYNISDEDSVYVEIIGNGKYNARSNARTLDWSGNEVLSGTIEATGFGTTLLNLIYPVGSIFMSVNNVNPGTYLTGTTWEAWGAGRVPVGVDTTQTEFDTVEETGGEKTHLLTGDESGVNSHLHEIPSLSGTATATTNLTGDINFHASEVANIVYSATGVFSQSAGGSTTQYRTVADLTAHSGAASKGVIRFRGNHSHTVTTNRDFTSKEYADADYAHNNLQPYITCYMWKRIA